MHHPVGMRSGPREQLLARGVSALSDEELVAVLLGTGRRGEPVTVLAAKLLRDLGGIAGLSGSGMRHLLKVSGIGLTKAARLSAAMELGRRACSQPLQRSAPLSSSREVYAAFGPLLDAVTVETFLVISVDAKNRPLGSREVARGGRVSCQVDPAHVFRTVLLESASGALFVHNHPSGDPEPSPDDLELTQRLAAAGALLGIRVLDHLIIGKGRYFSFRDEGRLGP